MKHVIDAKNKKIGRIASQAAMILMGKNAPTYERNKVAEVQVEIINTSRADISNAKKEDKNMLLTLDTQGDRKTKVFLI